ncbi:MAG: hypothetical protein J0L82_12475 [Deltaproteobacteria bacterium]|nr:hypothetical protein [Deltaproteobacteria bacterium]
MSGLKSISSAELRNFAIDVIEPFAEFLMAERDEYQFKVTLLDVVRFAGHACPAMIGAFLLSQRAIKELFPETNICIRGLVSIEVPGAINQGATGPISNVFSMIFGAWDQSGFGGLQGRFIRRGLLSYGVQGIPTGSFRFRNLVTGKAVDVKYDPTGAQTPENAAAVPFQKVWRHKIASILESPNDYITSHNVDDRSN